jgi:hypothetical protein
MSGSPITTTLDRAPILFMIRASQRAQAHSRALMCAPQSARKACEKSFTKSEVLQETMLHNSTESVQILFRSFLNSYVLGLLKSESDDASLGEDFSFCSG